jgi:hypothetical protein
VAAQHAEDRVGGEEGIGDRAAVVDREGDAELTVGLRHQQRMRRDCVGAVEVSEALKCQLVVCVSRPDGYGGRSHGEKDRLRKWF